MEYQIQMFPEEEIAKQPHAPEIMECMYWNNVKKAMTQLTEKEGDLPVLINEVEKYHDVRDGVWFLDMYTNQEIVENGEVALNELKAIPFEYFTKHEVKSIKIHLNTYYEHAVIQIGEIIGVNNE